MKKDLRSLKPCPLCKSSEAIILFTSYNRHGRHDIDRKDTFTVMRCKVCDIVFLADINATPTYYKKYYDTGYYDGGLEQKESLVNKVVYALETWSLKQKEKNLLKYFPNHKGKLRILDVGCGSGKFLESLDSKKFEKHGIEINKEGIELSRKKGFTVYDKDITEINFGKKRFDIITMWHVQEHLTHPIAVFNTMHKILDERGIVLSATPNTDSLGFKIGKAKWFHLDSPRHLMLFNKKSNAYICEKTNFDVVEGIHEFYDYPLDLFWSVKDTAWRYLIYPLYPLAKLIDHEALIAIFKKR